MLDRRIPTAALVRFGENEAFTVLLLEYLHPTNSAQELWDAAPNGVQRREIIRSLVSSITAHHAAGLIQEDLHLDNFLFMGETVYTIDGASIKVETAPLSIHTVLDNLALLFAQLTPAHDPLAIEIGCEALAANADSRITADQLGNAIDRRRNARKRDWLKKIFRTCSAIESYRDNRRYAVWDRHDDSPGLRTILEDPDVALNQSHLLKKGRTSTVGIVELGDRRILIKRYNLKNFWHACNRALRETRASISWRNAHRLRFYGIATPRPIALVEKRWGPIRRESYFICEYMEAESCARYLMDENRSSEEKDLVVDRLCDLLKSFGKLLISHGDTKATNFLIAQNTPWVIDLDAMREFDNPARFASAHARDIKRFMRNWDSQPRIRARFDRCLNESVNVGLNVESTSSIPR
ncbi:MAG TPA: lipopolysaccharide kinase InaA family protein [Burkholderiales bacterium]|nr:lipopolysaccharide kinase InaA family protein [Burkholderiales bacterium]